MAFTILEKGNEYTKRAGSFVRTAEQNYEKRETGMMYIIYGMNRTLGVAFSKTELNKWVKHLLSGGLQSELDSFVIYLFKTQIEIVKETPFYTYVDEEGLTRPS